MPTVIAATSHRDDVDFFSETRKLLGLLVRLNVVAKPIFDAKSKRAVDMVRMRWTEEGGMVLGEIAEFVTRHARSVGRRWNAETKTWEPTR